MSGYYRAVLRDKNHPPIKARALSSESCSPFSHSGRTRRSTPIFVRDMEKARVRYGDRVDIAVGDLAYATLNSPECEEMSEKHRCKLHEPKATTWTGPSEINQSPSGGQLRACRIHESEQRARNYASAFCVALLRCLVNRAAAITWPRAIPPSFGGTR